MISKIYNKRSGAVSPIGQCFVHDQMGENKSRGQHYLQLAGGQSLVCERKRLRHALFSS